jgi:sugar/nucleoside kinase (ribokinase family)
MGHQSGDQHPHILKVTVEEKCERWMTAGWLMLFACHLKSVSSRYRRQNCMANLLVIGAVSLDRPVWIDRPLVSGGRLRGRSQDGMLAPRLGGGGANAACALMAAGHQVKVATSLADDPDGSDALTLAQAAGLDLSLASFRAGRSPATIILIDPTGERTIIGMDGKIGTMPDIPPPQIAPDYRPDGLFIRAPYLGAAAWAEMTAGPIILHWPAQDYAGRADVVVTSAGDLDSVPADQMFEKISSQMNQRPEWVIVSRGAQGAQAFSASLALSARAPAANVVDATGAGDIFAAGILDALCAGAHMADALAHACQWGAWAVGQNGSAPDKITAAHYLAFGQGPG